MLHLPLTTSRARAARVAVALATVLLPALACSDDGGDTPAGPFDHPGQVMRDVTIPVTPDVPNLASTVVGGVREFRLRAHVFKQKIATFPVDTAEVWGYNGVTPGPTAIAYEGERVRFIVQNDLPEPTSVHFHGAHPPNDADGVAGVSQPTPIPAGGSYTYEFTPGHAGTFAYHAHTSSAKQELKGLDAFFIVLPRQEPDSHHVDRDFAFVLQSWFFKERGQPVEPFPPGGEFNFHTMNGKTRDAASEQSAKVGERVRLRIYNASQLQHAMHQHGFDLTVESQNGHERPHDGRYAVTTVDLGPGNFFEITFVPDKPGKWIFHCHFPHHTTNDMKEGPEGSPVGMARVINVTQ